MSYVSAQYLCLDILLTFINAMTTRTAVVSQISRADTSDSQPYTEWPKVCPLLCYHVSVSLSPLLVLIDLCLGRRANATEVQEEAHFSRCRSLQ
jgi:hypothetical protein